MHLREPPAHITIRNNIIKKNVAGAGGGGGIYCGATRLDLIGNLLIDNETTDIYRGGGGILTYAYSTFITGNVFQGNKAPKGGGMSCTGTFYVWRNMISGSQGTGVEALAGNLKDHGARGEYFGGYLVENRIVDSQGVGMVCGADIDSSILVQGNWVEGNMAPDDQGGGLAIGGFGYYEATGNVILKNTAKRGGGIHCGDSPFKYVIPVLGDNLVVQNVALEEGGGIHCYAYGVFHPEIRLVNNTIAENAAQRGGGMCFERGSIVMANSVLWENSASSGAQAALYSDAEVSVEYSDVQGGIIGVEIDPGGNLQWGPGMIDSDPLFFDPAAGDYHLTFNSPCRGSGSNQVEELPALDFEGDPRIAYGTADMGCDEFYRHLYVTGEETPGGAIQGKLVGLPGTEPLALILGSGILQTPLTTLWGSFYLDAPWLLIPLAPLKVPAQGILAIPATIPPGAHSPFDLPMQALIGTGPDGLSNLEVLRVR